MSNSTDTMARPVGKSIPPTLAKSQIGAARGILIIVENLPVPFDRRVWSEATTLSKNGYKVTVICPKGKGAEMPFEIINDIHVYRHWLPSSAKGFLGYLAEYSVALFWEFVLSLKVLFGRGFDVIHACNPPDLIFLVGGFYKLFFGKVFVFDHHDICPELYEAKYGRRGLCWRAMVRLERWTFSTADISIATNESYRSIAMERGRMDADHVFVVRSGPDLSRVRRMPPDDSWKNGKASLVAYVGVIGEQEGLDLLLDSTKYIRESRKRNDIQYVIVGSGPALPAMKKRALALGVEDIVTFTNRVDDRALFTILSTADICVNPDRPNAMNDKSTMNKILEYMALGKAIVQFDLTEGRFSARDASLYARNTDVEDFGNKILEIIDDPGRRARMGDIGRRRVVEELSWDHEAPKLLAAYDKLFGTTQHRI